MDLPEMTSSAQDVSFDFARRRVLITGAGSGIGLATAAAFAAAGADVVVVDVDAAAATAARATVPGAVVEQIDITDEEAVAGLVSVRGPFDIVVNNAMICGDDDLLTIPPRQMRREVEVNLIGPMIVAQAVLPGMIRRAGGVIVNVSSINALLHLGNEAYSAAKSGLLSLTRSIATEYGPSGVRCNAIALGTVETPYWEHRRAQTPGVLDRLVEWYPLRAIGAAEDAAASIQFLASDAARWITGAVLTVDGGFTAGNLRMSADIHGADHG